MTSHPDSTRVAHDALHRPIQDIAWSDDRRPHDKRERKKFRNAVAATLGISATVAGCLALPSADAARLADPECYTHTVTRGDTLSSIARNYDTTLDALKAMNPQLARPSWDAIWPGDEVAIVCLGDAQPPARVEHVDVSRWLDERELDGRLTWRSVVANLYEQGMRGDDLVTLAAIAQCESNRFPWAEGDQHLANGTWSNSIGILQVRSLHAQQGTGGPRDIDALRASVAHQSWAAVEVFRSQGFPAWTCWRNGHHKGLIDTVRQAGAEIGVL